MNTTIKKHDKIESQIKATLDFMLMLCAKCSARPTSVSVSSTLRDKGNDVHRSTMHALEDLGYIKTEGKASGLKYHWVRTTPTEEQAESVLEKAKQIHTEYQMNHKAETAGFKETVRTSRKSFIRIITKPEAETKKEAPKFCSTPTELSVQLILNKVRTTLGSHEVIDFDAYCLAAIISYPMQYALISLGLITKERGKGFKFKEPKVTYELVRQVIDKRKEYVDGVTVMPTIVETIPTPAQPVEMSTPLAKTHKNDIKFLTAMAAIYRDIKAYENNSVKNEPIKSLTQYATDAKVPGVISLALKELNYVVKENNAYKWLKPAPVMHDAIIVSAYCHDYQTKAKRVQRTKDAESTDTTPNVTVEATHTTPKVDKVEEEVVSLDKGYSKDRKAKLAEMFAKVGNYDMAEKLLNEVL